MNIFVNLDGAAEVCGLSRKQFDRAIARVGLKPFRITKKNSMGFYFVQQVIVDNKARICAETGYPKTITKRAFSRKY